MAKILEISSNQIVWLDKFVNSEENLNLQKNQLQTLINGLEIFEEIFECEKYIQSLSIEQQLILIINGKDLNQEIISHIHQYEQIHSIFIYCSNTELSQLWSEQFRKIKGIYDKLDKLISEILFNRRRRRQNDIDQSFSMSIYGTNFKSDKSSSNLDGSFIHSQLLIDCLLRMEPTFTDKDDFILYCLRKFKDNKHDLKIVQTFLETYQPENSIRWYSMDTFLYRILNCSLRTQNIDLLFGLRFLIRDIEKQIKAYRCKESMRLYRGQRISSDELDILKKSVGKLISINSFFSTSVNRDVAMVFLDPLNYNYTKDSKRVLFEIHADPNHDGIKPFANIKTISCFTDEDEILMMLGSVFRLDKINHDENDIWIITMTLCSDNDHDLKSVFDHMRSQYGYDQARLLAFGNILVDMAHFNDAEKYYRRLLKEIPENHKDLSKCYHALGKVACEQGCYEASLEWFNKSLKDAEKKFHKNHPRIGFIYTGMGEVYQKKCDYNQALLSYTNALNIWNKAFNNNEHEYLAWCFNNIATIYEKQGKYLDAFNYHKKALNIKEQILPKQHPCLGNSYLNLGNIYFHFKQYDQAIINYELSLQIFEISLPPEHPSIASAKQNIGIIYEIKKDYSKALEYYEKAFSIRQQTFLSTHLDNIKIEKYIQRILLKKKQSFI